MSQETQPKLFRCWGRWEKLGRSGPGLGSQMAAGRPKPHGASSGFLSPARLPLSGAQDIHFPLKAPVLQAPGVGVAVGIKIPFGLVPLGILCQRGSSGLQEIDRYAS